MNLQKQQLLLREFLFDGIGRLGLLDDAAVILGAVLTVFFPDGD